MKKNRRGPLALFYSLFGLATLAGVFLCGPNAVRADSKSNGIDQTSSGKVIVLNLFTALVKPLKPQDYQRQIVVYLPAAYFDSTLPNQRFPVIYLLHGSPGEPTDFIKNGHWQIFLEQTAKADGFLTPILVAPDGNYTEAAFGDSEWLNSADSANKFEDFIVDRLVPWIDKHYRTVPTAAERVIGGVSEGGYGSVNIALHNPAVFGSVLALSGYYRNDGSGWARRIMGHNREFLAFNSPLNFVDSPVAVASDADIWTQQHYFIASGLDEKRYTTESQEMVDSLQAHKISADLYQVDGKHGWELWNTLFIAGLTDIFSTERSTTRAAGMQYQQTQ